MLRAMFDSTKSDFSQKASTAGYNEFELNILAGITTIYAVPGIVLIAVCHGIIELVHLVSRRFSTRKTMRFPARLWTFLPLTKMTSKPTSGDADNKASSILYYLEEDVPCFGEISNKPYFK